MQHKGDTPVPGYSLTKFLGKGGYGEVWQASAPGGTPAALKFVSLNAAQGLKEFRAVERIKAIRHANLLPIHAFWVLDSDGQLIDEAAIKRLVTVGSIRPLADTLVGGGGGAQPGTLIMAMPLGDKNLAQRLSECRAAGMAGIPPAELLDMLEDAARGIDYLNSARHDLGEGPVAVSHADIKPQNIMLVGSSAQLCDFGLARVLRPNAATTAGAGTPAYIAPEILAERLPTPTSDEYSLGVTYIELRTGRLPFSDSGSYLEVLDAHLKGKLDLTALPEGEREVIKKATARQPGERFANCMDVVRALRSACASSPNGGIIPRVVTGGLVGSQTTDVVTPAGVGLDETLALASNATPSTAAPSNADSGASPSSNWQSQPAAALPPSSVALAATSPSPSAPATLGATSVAPPLRTAALPIGAGLAALLAAVVGIVVWSSQPPSTPEIVPADPSNKALAVKDPPKQPEVKQPEVNVKQPEVKVKQPEVSVKQPEVAVKQPEVKQPDVKAAPTLAKSVTNSVAMTLLLIPAGKFTMGSPADERERGPYETEHEVEIARPFYLAAHEVTQAQFQDVLGKNPSHFTPTGGGRRALGDADPAKWPVENVSYADAVAFCEQLTARKAEQDAGRVYRLPTEAEWEYACRAGGAARFSSGDELLPRFARCDFGPAGGVPQPKTPATVGSLTANAWGLFDMHGNVAEWCLDWYSDEPAGGVDPRGPAQGALRVIRGGGFYDPPAKVRSADRFRTAPATTDMAIGFRVLCEAPPDGR